MVNDNQGSTTTNGTIRNTAGALLSVEDDGRNGTGVIQCPSCETSLRRHQVAEHCEEEMDRLRNMRLAPTPSGDQTTVQNGVAGNKTTCNIADNSEDVVPVDVVNQKPATTTIASACPGTGQNGPWNVFQRVQKNRQTRMMLRSRKRTPPSMEMNAISTASAVSTPGFSSERNGHIENNDGGDDNETSLRNHYYCPLCNLNIPLEQKGAHAENCVRRSKRLQQTNEKAALQQQKTEGSHASSSNGDVGMIEHYEEYEWAGQKRIRLCSLLPGGYAALGIGTNITNRTGSNSAHNQDNNEDDEDEDLNVDDDDTQIYGAAQYSENDIIPVYQISSSNSHVDNDDGTEGNVDGVNNEVDNDVTSYMRRLIARVDDVNSSVCPSCDQLPSSSEASTVNVITSSTLVNDVAPSTSSTALSSVNQFNYKLIVEALKVKIRSYESQTPQKYKCLICLDDYKNPAISVACWHVYCEECWLRSLGYRKLCPQCNFITTPKDLRRIYM